jgi:PQQ-dependent dehydrogenase (methanol/ethanol family)
MERQRKVDLPRSLQRSWQVAACVAMMGAVGAPAALADSSIENIRNCEEHNWCYYDRDQSRAWRHSPLGQIDTENVQDLRPAWIFQPGEVRQGMHVTPLVVDGHMYVATNPSTVWSLNAATGDREWVYVPDMDPAVISRSFFSHTRGLAIGGGRVYMGRADGHLVALDERTGEVIWDEQIVDSQKETAGISGAGVYVSADLLVIGQNGGEYPIEGKIFGINPNDGSIVWTFHTTGRGDDAALATWGGDSWKYGGGGSWQPGTVDYANNQIFLGTGNPNPDYDYCGADCRDPNVDAHRPGDNLYTSSTVALDLDTGKLNWHFQEAPSDPYDYDAAPGEYMIFDDNGRGVVMHVGKNGFIHVHDAKSGQPLNIYSAQRTQNWTTGFNLETGQWENMLWPKAGEKTLVCPAIDGGHSWNHGSYSPETGLFYRTNAEWCMWLTIAPKGGADYISAGSEERTTEPFAQAFMAAEWIGTDPPGESSHSVLTAKNPITGDIAWSRRYDIIPHSSLLSTGGGLLFNGTYDGYLEAIDAEDGSLLWKFNNGSSHNGGIISYAVGGTQYIGVVTGQGSYFGYSVTNLNKDRGNLLNLKDAAAIVAFSIK